MDRTSANVFVAQNQRYLYIFLRFFFITLSLNIFIYSELENKLLGLILIPFWVRVLPCRKIYRGVFYVQYILLSLLRRVSHVWSPSDGLLTFLKTILANGFKREPQIHSLKFSLRNEDRTRNLCVSSTTH